MSGLKIYSFPGDSRVFKAQIAAQYNGVEIERPAFDLAKDGKSKAFRAKSPMGQVPLLETAEGCIFESNAIARYVARLRRDTGLYGQSFFDSACVDQWVDFAANELEFPATMWVYPILGLMDFNAEVTGQAKGDLKKALSVLEQHLKYETFLVGNRVTLADIVCCCALFYPMKMVLDEKFRKPFPSVVRWFVTLVNQPEFAAVLGPEVPLCAEELRAAGAPAGGDKKSGKKKNKGNKQQAKKKDAKKEEKKVEEAPKKAKKKGHFDGLKKSPMILDVWKKAYSNSRGDYYASMTKFWEMLDREGYSIWFCTYNYNEDNKIDFQTSNLVGGFVQRCDELRRYAFGVMQIIGSGPFEIEGAWLIRGKAIEPMLEANPDAEYYTWTAMDLNDEAQKTRLGHLWCAEEAIDGKPCYDCKVFK